MLDYEKVRRWQSPEIRQVLSPRDAMLYALGLGIGQDPLDPRQLRFATEKNQQVMPSIAALLGYPGPWMRHDRALGIDALRLVHGEQAIELNQPIPLGVPLLGVSRVTRVVDKGTGKGALVYVEKSIREESSGALVASSRQTLFCRGDGGFSVAGGGDGPAPPMIATPERAPDVVVSRTTRAEAALIYRLSGDMNPLHADPDVASRAGFPRPILHGLATYGMACHALIEAFCSHEAARLRSLEVRFSSPVFPGDAIEFQYWREGGEIALRAQVPERKVVVLTHGRAVCDGTVA